jgi:hypothetical protein
MNAREFALGMHETSKLIAERGAAVRIRSGYGSLTQHNDPKDHILNAGDAMPLSGGGATMITACQPTLLELYRHDPVVLREQITRRAHRARNDDIGAFFARFFR